MGVHVYVCVCLCVCLGEWMDGWTCEYVFLYVCLDRWMNVCVCVLCVYRGMDRQSNIYK